MSANVFISFASQDRKVANALCAALESRGFSCWISNRDIAPGDNFQSAIVSAIRDSKVMLLVFTANSNTSDEMTKELALASQQKLIVVPLRVEDVAPNAAFAYEFATRQWIDFFVDWEKAIDQLCERLSRAMPPKAPDAATPAAQPLASAPGAAVPAAAANKTNVGLLVGIGVTVLLLIGAVVALPMLTGKKTTGRGAVASAPAAPVSTPTASAAPVTASQAAEPQSASAAASSAPAPVQAAPRHAHVGLAAARAARLPVDTTSDAYVCAHGDETDSRTIQACDRKDRAVTEAATR